MGIQIQSSCVIRTSLLNWLIIILQLDSSSPSRIMPFQKKLQISDPDFPDTKPIAVLMKASTLELDEMCNQEIPNSPVTTPVNKKFPCRLCGTKFISFDKLEKHSTSPINRWISKLKGRNPSFGL